MWKHASLPLYYWKLYILLFNIFQFSFSWITIFCGTPKPKLKYFGFKKFKPKLNRKIGLVQSISRFFAHPWVGVGVGAGVGGTPLAERSALLKLLLVF